MNRQTALEIAAKKTSIAFIEQANKEVMNSKLVGITLDLQKRDIFEVFVSALKFEMGI